MTKTPFSAEPRENTQRGMAHSDTAHKARNPHRASDWKARSPKGFNPEATDNTPEDKPILAGLKPVLEMLQENPARIDSVFVKKGLRNQESGRILDLCRDHSIRFTLSEAAALDRLYAGNHQGVVARLSHASFMELSELLKHALTCPLPLLIALDQVLDPGNAGTLARTLHAMGGAGLIVPLHNSAYLGAGAHRAAAGALEHMPVSRVNNLSHALESAEEALFTVYGASLNTESLNVFTTPLNLPAVLVLGSEEKGIRPGVAKRCQTMLHIPMQRTFNSLNVAQAGAIFVAQFSLKS